MFYVMKSLFMFDIPSIIFVHNTAQKFSFPLRISSVNVPRSVGNFGFGHTY